MEFDKRSLTYKVNV